MNQQNPLMKYQRQPELYLTLPSKGKWWSEEALDMPESGELAIYPMTGRDEFELKHAEGLMNGESTVSVIQSCVPSIKNAWSAPLIDIDALYIGIRIASVGNKMDVNITCPKCSNTETYQVDLGKILQTIKYPNYDDPLLIDEMYVFCRPASYKIATLNAQQVYEQQRAIQAANSNNLSNEQKEKIIKESIYKLTEISVGRLSEYIEKIVINHETVHNTSYIQEFLNNADRKTFQKIKKGIEEKNNSYAMPKIPFKCSNVECGYEGDIDFQFDPGNFFVADS